MLSTSRSWPATNTCAAGRRWQSTSMPGSDRRSPKNEARHGRSAFPTVIGRLEGSRCGCQSLPRLRLAARRYWRPINLLVSSATGWCPKRAEEGLRSPLSGRCCTRSSRSQVFGLWSWTSRRPMRPRCGSPTASGRNAALERPEHSSCSYWLLTAVDAWPTEPVVSKSSASSPQRTRRCCFRFVRGRAAEAEAAP